ncbi:ArfGap-domain-containing protein [Melanogaster broomeanus]|nr:ArfGap-domain-containing protein [Melanogaster broomeanus]
MTNQIAVKKFLQDLIKREDLANKTCVDCGNPNPQWASVSFAIFLCLQCAGIHRGFGVHISFVRSVSMDTWQSDQIKRMELGGNAPFKQFMQSYTPAEQGGYKDGMDSYALYHSWAASQYRQKLDYALAGKSWTPSSPPVGQADTGNVPARPSSAQGLRKSRASARSPPTAHSSTSSPFNDSPRSSPDPSRADQKSANETYFASLGEANAARPTDLPPSQGGRYQGFGNTPSPPPPSQHPAFGLTSSAAPSLADFQENPGAALGKGWSIFSAAVAGASRVVAENVVRPGMERVMDPNLHASVRGYVSEAQRRAQLAGQSANEWSKTQLGVDVADHVTGIVGTVRDRAGAGPQASGYDYLAAHNENDSSPLYQDDPDDLFYEASDTMPTPSTDRQASTLHTTQASSSAQAKKDDDWDEW